jgi:cytochrome c-type biogenesis protein
VSTSGYVVAFGGGVVSFLSPCVLPLVPAYLSLTAGVGLSERRPGPAAAPEAGDGWGSAAALRAGALFVAGFSVVFVLLGLSATALGSLLLSEHVPVTRLAGLAVLVMALTMLVTAVPMRRLTDREFRFHPRLSRYGTWAAPVAGAAFAFGWTPCIGPVLGSVLAVAADQHRLGQGALLLAMYAAGLAVPFLIAALALHRSLIAFRFARRHSVFLLRGSAAVLAAYGLLLALDQLSGVTVQLQRGVTALGLGQLIGLG